MSTQFTRIGLCISAILIGGLCGSWLREFLIEGPTERQPLAEERTPKANLPIVQSLLTANSQKQAREANALTAIPQIQGVLWIATQAENASPSEFRRLLQLADGYGELSEGIACRWAETDPAHMFTTLLALRIETYNDILFESWTKANPTEALKVVHDWYESGHGTRKTIDYLLTSYLLKNSPEIGFEAIMQLDLEHTTLPVDQISELISENPKAAADKVATLKVDFHTTRVFGPPPSLRAMDEIGKVWGSTDPEEAIRYASTLRDANGHQLAKAAIAAWAEEDPQAASNFATAENDPVFRARLCQGFALQLANTDPVAAISWATDNLQSTSRAGALDQIMKAWRSMDPDAAKAWEDE